MQFFRARANERYGQSVRAPNLLPDIQAVAPQTRFIIIVRDPLDYVVSAHSKQVFRKGGEWDDNRIMPPQLNGQFNQLSLAEKIAWHWVAINRHLLDFAEANPACAKVRTLRELTLDLPNWVSFLGVTIKDAKGLNQFLMQRPNAAATHELPQGYDKFHLTEICGEEWRRAQKLARD